LNSTATGGANPEEHGWLDLEIDQYIFVLFLYHAYDHVSEYLPEN